MDSSWAQRKPISVSRVLSGLGIGAITCFGAVMAVTNPSQAAYETYATQEMVTFLDQNVCSEAPKAFDLRNGCKVMLKTNRPQIKSLIADGTRQRNFIFFSVYTTNVSAASFLPSYQVETIGAFRQFHVYAAETK